jgi:uncharacterized protein
VPVILRTFGWSFVVTIVCLVGAFVLGGPTALALVAILSVLEISLSFDNAVVNATILVRMNAFWQKMFLSVGIIIAVFGMRLVFPLVIVGVTAKLNPVEAVRLALDGGSIDEPGTYAYLLHAAHPSIAAFGGMFLFMLFLDFIFEDRDIRWLTWIERPLAKIGKLDQLSVVVALAALTASAELFAENVGTVMVSGALGIITYLLVNGLGELFEAEGHVTPPDDDELTGIHGDAEQVDESLRDVAPEPARSPSVVGVAGRAAFFLFLYLEALDASFSFDGVIGAFAITQDIFIIATGLGVGAMYIRSLTVYLVRKGTLSDYVYLEHGAHWAIGALAVILLVTIRHEVPEVVTGLVGVGFIGAAFVSSLIRNRGLDRADGDGDGDRVGTIHADA